jgi:hypothetical protein
MGDALRLISEAGPVAPAAVARQRTPAHDLCREYAPGPGRRAEIRRPRWDGPGPGPRARSTAMGWPGAGAGPFEAQRAVVYPGPMRRLLLPLALAACAPSLPPATAQALATRAVPIRSDDPPAAAELEALTAIVRRGAHRRPRSARPRLARAAAPAPSAVSAPVRTVRFHRPGARRRRHRRDCASTPMSRAPPSTSTRRCSASQDRDLATAELRDLLTWARERNASGQQPPLRVFGLDPGDPDAAAALVLDYLAEVDPRMSRRPGRSSPPSATVRRSSRCSPTSTRAAPP